MLVSIGIPVYSRLEGFERALKSALVQTYQNIEILISNDHSPVHEIHELAIKYAQTDSRIKYFYQDPSLKTVNNFKFLPKQARGNYFLWIADDDWIDENYVEECVQFLQNNLDYTICCGKCNYHADFNTVIHNNTNINIDNDLKAFRIMTYFRTVSLNGYFYGLMRKEKLDQFSIPNEIGFDWSLVGYLAFKGKIKTLETTNHHLSKGGMSNESSDVSKYFPATTNIKRTFIGFATAINAANAIKKHLKVVEKMNFLTRNIYFFLIFTSGYINIIKWDFIILKRIILRKTLISKSGRLTK